MPSLFETLFKVNFFLLVLQRCLYNKQKNTCLLGDMEFLSSSVQLDISLIRCAQSIVTQQSLALNVSDRRVKVVALL